jgi:hypothetical protein
MTSDLVAGLMDSDWYCHGCGKPYKPHPDPSSQAEATHCPECLAKPSHATITTGCPYCNKVYEWDAEQDNYPRAEMRSISLERDFQVSLWFCTCGAVLATMVVDSFGGQLYTPCTEEM